jgi:dolichol-phosphate mannosyltransferase
MVIRPALRRAWWAWRWLSLAILASRLARAVHPARVVTSGNSPIDGTISVIVPARDEVARIGPLLEAMLGAPGVGEVIVVDDESTDATADLAARLGATVVAGRPVPAGWSGKAWALHQGIERAVGDWLVCLDADTRPSPELPLTAAARATARGEDFVTVAGRFDCPTPAGRWLHAALLTTLVDRYGPPSGRRPRRLLANGQCMVIRRQALAAAGGVHAVRGQTVEDVALARRLEAAGAAVAFVDGTSLLTVLGYGTIRDTFTGWGRSIALPGVEPPARQLVDAALLATVNVVPLGRLAAGRATPVDAVALALRVGTLAGTARAFARRGVSYWLSPLADPVALVAVVRGICRPHQPWRGRGVRAALVDSPGTTP